MTRIAFIQGLAVEYLGVMSLSAVLKQHGHTVELFLLERDEERLVEQVLSFQPNIAAFSVTTGSHQWPADFAAKLKHVSGSAIMTLFGGPHPTFFPEYVEHPGVDVVCRGEGEQTILDLAQKLDADETVHDTLNCWVKADEQIVRNGLRPLIQDLDSLPYPDRSLYWSKYPYLRKSTVSFMAGRGCPFRCTFCFNSVAQELYRGLGRYVRWRSPENCVQEITEVRDRYGMRTVYLQDDTLLSDKQWVAEFTGLYEKNVKLPLLCLLRADQVDEPSLLALKKAGLKNAFFGIESGVDSIRNRVLKKGVKDEKIYRTAELLRKHGVKFRTYNMVGIPTETLEDAFETLRMNARIRTDYPWCSIFYPFPGTELGRMAEEVGLLGHDTMRWGSSSFFTESALALPYADQLANLQKLFWYGVKFPSLIPLIRRLVNAKPNRVYDALFLISYAVSLYGSESLTLREVVSLGLRTVRRFYG
jgi:anaerobic magnesium-protoporphyrin IX monomethyl ester cyclase